MYKCDICSETFPKKSLVANHVRWKHKKRELERECEFCGLKMSPANFERHVAKCQHYNTCKNCGNETKNNDFCCKRCSAIFNNKKGATGFAAYRRKNNIAAQETHRDICFQNWEPKCAIPDCGWSIAVDVHHIDGCRDNNAPNNLIPLCRNHHQMTEMIEHRDEMKLRCERLIEIAGMVFNGLAY